MSGVDRLVLVRRERADVDQGRHGLAAARRGLEGLYDQYLLSEPTAGRYRMHDLIREHARALAARADADRDQATERLLEYYQYTAARADALITRQARPAPAAAEGSVPAAVPTLANRVQALAWARAERPSLIATLDYATATGQHARVIGLTAGLAALLQSDGPWAEAIRHQAAIQAARHLGDWLGQANALHDLGDARRLTDDYPAAARAQEQALGIYRDLGDRLGQANALHDLGVVQSITGDYPVDALLRAHVRRDTDSFSAAGRDSGRRLCRYTSVLALRPPPGRLRPRASWRPPDRCPCCLPLRGRFGTVDHVEIERTGTGVPGSIHARVADRRR